MRPARDPETSVVGGPVERVGAGEQSSAASDLDGGTSHRLVRSTSRRHSDPRSSLRITARPGADVAGHGESPAWPDAPDLPAHLRQMLPRSANGSAADEPSSRASQSSGRAWTQPTQAGPSSCFRSATSDGDGLTRSLSSSFSTFARLPRQQPQVHLGRPRVRPQHLPEPLDHGRDAPRLQDRHHERAVSPAVSSGVLTSIATSFGTSSRRSRRPLTSTIASSMIWRHARAGRSPGRTAPRSRPRGPPASPPPRGCPAW